MYKTFRSATHQQGWVILEVLFCLLLLAAVLHLSEKQSHSQWSSIHIANESRKRAENHQNQEVFEHLIGEELALETDLNTARTYPHCDLCSGDELKQWFYTSQHAISSADGGNSP